MYCPYHAGPRNRQRRPTSQGQGLQGPRPTRAKARKGQGQQLPRPTRANANHGPRFTAAQAHNGPKLTTFPGPQRRKPTAAKSKPNGPSENPTTGVLFFQVASHSFWGLRPRQNPRARGFRPQGDGGPFPLPASPILFLGEVFGIGELGWVARAFFSTPLPAPPTAFPPQSRPFPFRMLDVPIRRPSPIPALASITVWATCVT